MKSRVFKISLIGLLSLFVLLFNPYKIVVVLGNSMYPTLKNGNVVLAKKTKNFRKGDIVIAKNDFQEIIIKRIAYMPQEYYYYIMTENQDDYRELIVDNSYHNISLFYDEFGDRKIYQYQVPIGQYFLLGDNLANSEDSRRFGSLENQNILYKVIK
jgi:signal peptidase I